VARTADAEASRLRERGCCGKPAPCPGGDLRLEDSRIADRCAEADRIHGLWRGCTCPDTVGPTARELLEADTALTFCCTHASSEVLGTLPGGRFCGTTDVLATPAPTPTTPAGAVVAALCCTAEAAPANAAGANAAEIGSASGGPGTVTVEMFGGVIGADGGSVIMVGPSGVCRCVSAALPAADVLLAVC